MTWPAMTRTPDLEGPDGGRGTSPAPRGRQAARPGEPTGARRLTDQVNPKGSPHGAFLVKEIRELVWRRWPEFAAIRRATIDEVGRPAWDDIPTPTSTWPIIRPEAGVGKSN